MNSGTFFGLAAIAFVAALLAYIYDMLFQKEGARRLATITAALGFLAQTVGLAFRWYEAGLHEVSAKEAAEHITLTGLTYFVTVTSHPPWSNLYEIMVFMSWGIVLAFLISDLKWHLRGAGVFAIGVALLALGIASLTLDATVTPLVPALRSYWLHLHVFSASLGYAAGLLGAIVSLLYLAASATNPHRVAFGAQLTIAILLILLGRGATLFRELAYKAKLLVPDATGGLTQVYQAQQNGEFTSAYASMSGVAWLMLLAILLAIVAMVWHRRAWRSEDPAVDKQARLISTASVTVLIVTVALILFQDLSGVRPALGSKLVQILRPQGDFRFGLASNQWDMGLFLIAVSGGLYSLWMLYGAETLRTRLPAAETLDMIAHRAIMVAFTFVAILIVTGAIWAHYAWGRYWGWDPKETGSLVIWFVYATYLHTRITHGLSGRPSAVIAIFGFFVVLAGFLGVNLGWFAVGLHSYGSN